MYIYVVFDYSMKNVSTRIRFISSCGRMKAEVYQRRFAFWVNDHVLADQQRSETESCPRSEKCWYFFLMSHDSLLVSALMANNAILPEFSYFVFGKYVHCSGTTRIQCFTQTLGKYFHSSLFRFTQQHKWVWNTDMIFMY